MNILSVENLSKGYMLKNKERINVLDKINLQVSKSEMTAIMGPSGSGKTTLLNIISGIDKADEGKVFLAENDLQKMNKSEMALYRRQKIGMVFQEYNLIDSLSVKENIILPMILCQFQKNLRITF